MRNSRNRTVDNIDLSKAKCVLQQIQIQISPDSSTRYSRPIGEVNSVIIYSNKYLQYIQKLSTFPIADLISIVHLYVATTKSFRRSGFISVNFRSC
jgi:hypothetical protein